MPNRYAHNRAHLNFHFIMRPRICPDRTVSMPRKRPFFRAIWYFSVKNPHRCRLFCIYAINEVCWPEKNKTQLHGKTEAVQILAPRLIILFKNLVFIKVYCTWVVLWRRLACIRFQVNMILYKHTVIPTRNCNSTQVEYTDTIFYRLFSKCQAEGIWHFWLYQNHKMGQN